MLRRAQLCPGGPGECTDVLMRDPRAGSESEACEECPATRLDAYLESAAGQLIQQTIGLDFALQAGVTIGLSDITYPEFLLLRFLSEERNRFQEEEIKRASHRGR